MSDLKNEIFQGHRHRNGRGTWDMGWLGNKNRCEQSVEYHGKLKAPKVGGVFPKSSNDETCSIHCIIFTIIFLNNFKTMNGFEALPNAVISIGLNKTLLR